MMLFERHILCKVKVCEFTDSSSIARVLKLFKADPRAKNLGPEDREKQLFTDRKSSLHAQLTAPGVETRSCCWPSLQEEAPRLGSSNQFQLYSSCLS